MTRKEQLEALAGVLLNAADTAVRIAPREAGGSYREAALAKQLEGIAMEYRAIAATLPRKQDEHCMPISKESGLSDRGL